MIFLLGLTFIPGIIICYTPQIITLLKKRHTLGVSFYSLLISNANGFTGTLNVLAMNVGDLRNCRRDTLGCLSLISIISQICLSWVFGVLIYACYMIFFTDSNHYILKNNRVEKIPNTPPRIKSRQWIACVLWTLLSIAMFAIFVIIYLSFIFVFGLDGSATLIYGSSMGYLTAALNIIQWLPQIFITIRSRGSGSLSIPGIFINVIGNWGQSIYMIYENQDPSVYASLIVCSVQVTVLFILLIFFDTIYPYLSKIRNKSRAPMLNVTLDEIIPSMDVETMYNKV
ncbi:hypothetical protein AKO1_006907, partial [Acrasis kona]